MPEPRVNQQSAVDTWYRRLYTDLEAGYHDTLAWSLVMMGRADAQLSRPAYRTFFNRYKDELLKAILTMIANKDDELRYSEREQKEMIAGVRKLGLDWPELDIIERSINPDSMLREEIAEFDEMPEDEQIQLVTHRSRAIRSITDPSEAVQLAAVKGYGLTIQYIENPSEAVQLAAVTENGAALQHIKDPSEAVKLAAVKDDGHAIEYINDPSEEIQLAAVMNDPDSIGYIKDPSEKTKLAAVERNWYAITYIKDQSPALQILAVIKNPDALEYMDYAHPEFWMDDSVKTRLITYILKNIKRGGMGSDHLVHMLEHLRCPWPELRTITKSLKADNKIQESEEDLLGKAIDTMSSGIDAANSVTYTNIFPMNMLARLEKLIRDGDISPKGVPAALGTIKDKILTYLLLQIKKGKLINYGMDIPRHINELRVLGVSWPELNAIEKSIKHDQSLTENYEEDQADIIAMIIEALTNGAGASMQQATRLLQSLDEVHLSKLKKLMQEKKHSIKANVLDLCFVPGRDTVDRTRDLFNAISPGWPEFQDIPHSLRNTLIAEFNDRAEEGGVTAAIDCIGALKTNGLEVTKLVRDFRQEMLPKLINDFAKDPHTPDYMLADNLDTMLDIGVKPEEINGVLNARKTTLVKAMLNSIKARRYNDANLLLDALQQFGMDWPELAVIENSLNSGSLSESEYADRIYAGHKYKDEIDQQVAKLSREIEAGTVSLALRGAIHVLSSRYRLRDEEIGSLLSPLVPALTERARRFLEGNAISIAIRDLKELQNIGLMTDELRSSVNDNKAAVMKFLLEIIKEKQNTNSTMRYIEFLEAVGIDWPEFGVIRKTAEAEFRDMMQRRDQQ